jgi:hypothetical protein
MSPAVLLRSSPVVSLTFAFGNSIQQTRTSRPLWPLRILRDLCDLNIAVTRDGHKGHKDPQRTQRKDEIEIFQYPNNLISQYQSPAHHSPLTTHPS